MYSTGFVWDLLLHINSFSQTLSKMSAFLAKILGGIQKVFLVILKAETGSWAKKNELLKYEFYQIWLI